MVWLCSVTTPSFLLAANAMKDRAILGTLFGLMAAVPVLVACVVAVFFGVSKTEEFRSGGYRLQRGVPEGSLREGGTVTTDALSRDARASPEDRQDPNRCGRTSGTTARRAIETA